METKIRVLVAKVGLDGHDVGATVVARGLFDAGMEVIYTGLRRTPDQIARTAVEEDVDCVGVSILSGAHSALLPRICESLREADADDILVVAGGVIPQEDIPELEAAGVAGVFLAGTTIQEISSFIEAKVSEQRENEVRP